MIWGTDATKIRRPLPDDPLFEEYDSARAGGSYFIGDNAKTRLKIGETSPETRARLTDWLIRERSSGAYGIAPKVLIEQIERASHARQPSIHDKVNQFLQYFADSSSAPGAQVESPPPVGALRTQHS